MRIAHAALLAAAIMFAPGALAAKDVDDKAVAPTVVDETLAFNPVAILRQGSANFCTAFYVGKGIFLSAGHCMGNPGEWRIETDNDNGGKKSFRVLNMMYSHPAEWNGQDVAIIFADPVATEDLRPLDLDCSGDVLPVGTPVATEGFPEDFGRNYTVGYVSAKPTPWRPGKGGWWHDVYRAQLPIAGGNSGGPVTNTDTGMVVGILVGMLPSNKALSTFQPIDFVCDVFSLGE